jgi:hypothetical protein
MNEDQNHLRIHRAHECYGARPVGSIDWLGEVEEEGLMAGRAIKCPKCGCQFSHITEAGTMLGGDEGRRYSGTEIIGTTPDRRSALAILFQGECGHNWEFRIQQHKGTNFLQIFLLADTPAGAEH